MILVDFSSIVHRKLHASISNIRPNKKDGIYITSEYIGLLQHYILESLLEIEQEFKNEFGELVICLDNAGNGYWRRDFYSEYKAQRAKARAKSDIDYKEVFIKIDQLTDHLKNNLAWKVIEVQKAEADDIMLVLAKEYSSREKILIHSPDKDMIQAQRGTDNVFQYSSLTMKWLVPENKHDDMDHWLLEHVCLGDASDNVPKVVDGTIFSDNFLNYLKECKIDVDNPIDFKKLDRTTIITLVQNYNVYKTNRAGEYTVKDVYKDIKFGPATLEKEIKKFGSLEKFLGSNEMYKENYERNYKLVMEEGIPDYIRESIKEAYLNAKVEFNMLEFENYLKENGMNNLVLMIGKFKPANYDSGPLTAADFGW